MFPCCAARSSPIKPDQETEMEVPDVVAPIPF